MHYKHIKMARHGKNVPLKSSKDRNQFFVVTVYFWKRNQSLNEMLLKLGFCKFPVLAQCWRWQFKYNLKLSLFLDHCSAVKRRNRLHSSQNAAEQLFAMTKTEKNQYFSFSPAKFKCHLSIYFDNELFENNKISPNLLIPIIFLFFWNWSRHKI